jgi:Bacterial extracellular solute-binding proteins, family 5 Middle
MLGESPVFASRRLGWLVAALCCLSIPACGQPATEGAALRLPLLGKFLPDPARASATELWVESLAFSGLFKFDDGMDVVPDLAVGLPTISQDGRSYAITIRSDGRFDDGSPVTAQDVAWSLTRAVSKGEGSQTAWDSLGGISGADHVRAGTAQTLSGVQVYGRHSLTIRLTHPDAGFLLDLALPAASVLEPSVVSSGSNWWMHGGSAAPFRIAGIGSSIILRANSHYDDGRPNLVTVILQPVATLSEARSLYRRRKLDASPVPSGDFPRAAALPGFQSVDSNSTFYVLADSTIPASTRKALAEALDPGKLTGPTSRIDPLDSVVPSQVVPEYPAVTDPLTYEPQLSRQVLATSPPKTLNAPPGPTARGLRAWLQRSWRAVGLRATRSKSESALSLIKVTVALPDAEEWLQLLGRAVFHGSNRAFDRLLRAAGRVVISRGLGPKWSDDNQAELMLLKNALVIPIGVEKRGYLISSRVQGLAATINGLEPSDENWATVTVG